MLDIDGKPSAAKEGVVAAGRDSGIVPANGSTVGVMADTATEARKEAAPESIAPPLPPASATSPAMPKPYEPEARGSLMVSPPPSFQAAGAAAETPISGSPPAPVVTLSSSRSPPVRARKGGPKRVGARKLGAMKLSSGGGAVQLSGFSEPEATTGSSALSMNASTAGSGSESLSQTAPKEADTSSPAAGVAVAPSARLAAAATAALATQPSTGKKQASGSIYRSTNDSSSSGGAYGGISSSSSMYRNGGTNSNRIDSGLGSRSASSYSSASVGNGNGNFNGYGGGSSGGGGSFDKKKYKDVKGIGSDMLFGARDDDPEEQARRVMKGQEYSQSAAISSDMYFDREAEVADHDAGGGVGLGDMAEQIAISAAAGLQGAAQAGNKLQVRLCT